jgi:hypothetical protein
VDIEIREETLKYTTKCMNDFSCLNGEEDHLCEIRYPWDETFFWIDPKFDRDCKYRTSFGTSFLCLCPTRREIYRRYQI